MRPRQPGKKADDLILVGYDGILDAVNMTMDGDLDAFVSLPNLDEGAMGVKLATALVMNSDYHYDREILYDCTLVTGEFVDGLTDQTIYEYAGRAVPAQRSYRKGILKSGNCQEEQPRERADWRSKIWNIPNLYWSLSIL